MDHDDDATRALHLVERGSESAMHAELATHGMSAEPRRGRGEAVEGEAHDAGGRDGKKFWHFLEMSLIMSTTAFCLDNAQRRQGFTN